MSAQIEQILEVINGINTHRRGNLSLYAISRARRKATSEVAQHRKITTQSVLDKQIRKLRPHIKNVGEFDGCLLSYLTDGSTELRDILLRHKVDEFDSKRIFDAFSSVSPNAVDVADSPDRVKSTTNRIIRDTSVARRVKDIYGYRCQLCGQFLENQHGWHYAEAHHLKPLSHKGPDIDSNVLCVCPIHHVILDYGGVRLESRDFTLLRHDVSAEFIDYHNTNVFKYNISLMRTS